MVAEKILFLTGSLAEKQLVRVLEGVPAEVFQWRVHNLGIKVAALMTGDMIRRRLTDIGDAQKILVPGRCRGDLAALTRHYGIPVERGPEELMDIPAFFGLEGKKPDLSRYDVKIFSEIVDAPNLMLDEILLRARSFVADGADVIDLGCLPETPFAHLADAVKILKAEGYQVSVDSMQTEELLIGGEAGADYLLSLDEKSLWVAEQGAATPDVSPASPGDLQSL
ncbi:MAG: DUF6513 domain-containing protein, partial [Candidatus Thiodiazotropha endolucinida]|nr:DUF6513 domain-containing protein [Candidatus Thiodiazotropha taylori]MCW4241748.1 DUF6513 domain-containing protein [Candidatus Thiodiazotropha taylori]